MPINWSTNLQDFKPFSQHQQKILRKNSSTINKQNNDQINNQQKGMPPSPPQAAHFTGHE